MTQKAPSRDDNGKLIKGGPSLNPAGRPKSKPKRHRTREDWKDMVLGIGEMVLSNDQAREAHPGMTMAERNMFNLAYQGQKDISASKAFVEHVRFAITANDPRHANDSAQTIENLQANIDILLNEKRDLEKTRRELLLEIGELKTKIESIADSALDG